MAVEMSNPTAATLASEHARGYDQREQAESPEAQCDGKRERQTNAARETHWSGQECPEDGSARLPGRLWPEVHGLRLGGRSERVTRAIASRRAPRREDANGQAPAPEVHNLTPHPDMSLPRELRDQVADECFVWPFLVGHALSGRNTRRFAGILRLAWCHRGETSKVDAPWVSRWLGRSPGSENGLG
jgi:hypothetical protein